MKNLEEIGEAQLLIVEGQRLIAADFRRWFCTWLKKLRKRFE
jgi:hypothetical protein